LKQPRFHDGNQELCKIQELMEGEGGIYLQSLQINWVYPLTFSHRFHSFTCSSLHSHKCQDRYTCPSSRHRENKIP